jgi:carboxyl-terminal processing protease
VYRAATWIIASLLAVLVLGLAYTIGYVSNDGGGVSAGNSGQTNERNSDSGDSSGGTDAETLEQIIDLLEEEYIDREEIDRQILYEAAINGIIENLNDTGTFYVDPVSFQTSIGPSGSFEGIGATVQQNEQNEIVVVEPIRNSPAEAAGIRSGDVILAVDGESTEGWTVDRAVLRIRGPKGSEVTLTVRHTDGTTEDITIVRDEIQVESVTTTPPGGALRDANGNEVTDIAYMRIAEFADRTPEEVAAIAEEAVAAGRDGLIIDLRGNPGGLLQETVDTADLFLDGGRTILIEVSSDGVEREFRSRDGGAALDIPIVVLQDQFSASGSEVLAAALRDNDRATIIGRTSFGKGTVNISKPLEDGGALFVTIARWLTPNGVLIDGVGVEPDIEVGPGPFDPQYDPREDAQIARAIEHLRTLQASEQSSPASVAP